MKNYLVSLLCLVFLFVLCGCTYRTQPIYSNGIWEISEDGKEISYKYNKDDESLTEQTFKTDDIIDGKYQGLSGEKVEAKNFISCDSKHNTEYNYVLKIETVDAGTIEKTFPCYLPPKEHTWGEWEYSCSEKKRECSVCGSLDIIKTGKEHKYGEWSIVKNPTCAEQGDKMRKCTECGYEEHSPIPKEEHKYENNWSIVRKPTFKKKGIRKLKCTVCGEEHKEKYSYTKLEVAGKCSSYKEISRNPDSYKGKWAKFTGEVVQVMDDYDETILRVNVTKDEYDFYEDTLYVYYNKSNKGNNRILEDDIITMYGQLNGITTYETVMSSEVSLPALKAWYIDIQN